MAPQRPSLYPRVKSLSFTSNKYYVPRPQQYSTAMRLYPEFASHCLELSCRSGKIGRSIVSISRPAGNVVDDAGYAADIIFNAGGGGGLLLNGCGHLRHPFRQQVYVRFNNRDGITRV